MRWADIEVPNRPAAMDARGRSACYPRGTFYPLSYGASTRDHRITKAGFRLCSSCSSRSQASFYLYARRTIANRAELAFALLRYSFGGDRPSQTARLARFPRPDSRRPGETSTQTGWYFTCGSARAGAPVQRLPPILRIILNPIPGYSKGPRGLSVLLRVDGIFTATSISPSLRLRQRPSRYAIHAGRNLPDKELRYLRTVIVTAAVYWGFGCELRGDYLANPSSLTFRHRAGVSLYTSSCDLAQTCVFDKQSQGRFSAASCRFAVNRYT